ncbi:hypothetical protein BRDID11004_47670 [Bradyrhizobium diazoefficiens]|uniref:Aspartyl/asparaginy/proline hydroxylase domain-containing protein n=1 Tax=Bradyrhizobium diazoefficiens TaxID=1355477 RepID=A0A810A1A1_9BRAD|nr:hypothetical protein [Bradyrhizobium diazoefficiens]BBZ94330.1 hypothetical protein F07S3_41630 [Bradyrhizobium diazoefficiens]BCE56418.1 hypothetical protein XF5B_39300 [Bradyrhizobium diazoefficiens]
MSKFAELAGKLDRIPHLWLAGTYDAPRLKAELDAIDPALFLPFRSKSRNADHIAKFWRGLSLVAPDGALHGDLTEEPYASRTNCQWTPAAESSPYIKQIVTELGGEGQRVRLMCIKAGGSLTWHRHGSEQTMMAAAIGRNRPNWYELIVHVPIRTNPDFSYEVIDTRVYELADYSAGKLEIHRKNYPQAEAWAFNSAHYHNVFNRSVTEDRYAIMLTLDIRMRKTFDLVSRAVDRYDGPWLPAL